MRKVLIIDRQNCKLIGHRNTEHNVIKVFDVHIVFVIILFGLSVILQNK